MLCGENGKRNGSTLNALERFGSLGNWDAPARMRSFDDMDFSPDDKWREAESLSRKDTVIASLGVAQLFLMVSLIATLWLSRGEKHLLPVAFSLYLLVLFVYATIAARADDLVTSRRSGLHTAYRSVRAFLWQWPFFIQLRLSVAAFLWPVMPIRLHTTLIEWAHKNESLIPLGRFWHYGLVFCGACQFNKGDRPFNELSKLAVNRRSDLFDLALNPKDYYIIVGIAVAVIASVFVSERVFNDREDVIYSMALVVFTGFAVYKIPSLRSDITGMVWFPMLYRRMLEHPEENEPELPQLDKKQARIRFDMFYRALPQMMITPIGWYLIYRW